MELLYTEKQSYSNIGKQSKHLFKLTSYRAYPQQPKIYLLLFFLIRNASTISVALVSWHSGNASLFRGYLYTVPVSNSATLTRPYPTVHMGKTVSSSLFPLTMHCSGLIMAPSWVGFNTFHFGHDLVTMVLTTTLISLFLQDPQHKQKAPHAIASQSHIPDQITFGANKEEVEGPGCVLTAVSCARLSADPQLRFGSRLQKLTLPSHTLVSREQTAPESLFTKVL